MENPFKKILHNKEVPKVLRRKLLNDIDKIKLVVDVADLFVIKYPYTIVDLLIGTGKNNKN